MLIVFYLFTVYGADYLINSQIDIYMIDNKKNQESLPCYQLTITNGSYPFKNAHISKVFSIQVLHQIEKGHKNMHQILQAYHSIQNSLLINITSISNNADGQAKIKYQYVDTPLAHYIRRFLHQNIQIKLQKLYIQVRELANKFVLKNINVIKAISAKNIGVKMSEVYRESASVHMNSRRKQVEMPDFKIFIDLSKCQLIQRMSNVARILIDTDKMIYGQISKQINDLLKKIESEQSAFQKRVAILYQIPKCNDNNLIPQQKEKEEQNVEEMHLGFSNKIKKRKKARQAKPNLKKESEQLAQETEEDTKSERITQKTIHSLQNIYPKQLTSQVNSIVERSKRTLKNFKQLVKIQR